MLTLRYYISVVTVVLGGSAQFYSYGIVNPAQRVLVDWLNETLTARSGGEYMSKEQVDVLWSFIVSSIAIGAIGGALLTSTLAEKFGRRNALIFNGIVNVLGAFCELVAKGTRSPEVLIIGRFILGANMGLTSGLVPMYLLEITPAKYRGPAATLHQILGGEQLWPLGFAFPGIMALFLCLSPKYTLMTVGDRDGAYQAVRTLVGDEDAKATFESLLKESVLERRGSVGTLKELFTRRDLRVPLTASVLIMVAQQFTGCTAVFAFSTDMFINAHVDPTVAQYATLAIGITYFLFACTSPYLVERIGRRPLSLFQLGACNVALILLSLFTYLQNFHEMEWASYGTIFALVLYMCVYGVGSPIPWMITGELFNQQFRSIAITVSIFVAWSLAFVVSTSYLPFQHLVGVSFAYLPFIVVLTISSVIIYFLLPETRGKDASEIVDEIRYRSRTVSWRAPTRDEVRRLVDRSGSQTPLMYSSAQRIPETLEVPDDFRRTNSPTPPPLH